MKTPIVLTIIGKDQPGIVHQVSEVLKRHAGNWSHSSMSSLGGQFAGILLATVPSGSVDACIMDLEGLSEKGLSIVTQIGEDRPASTADSCYELDIVGHDRAGIVQEITGILAGFNVNVTELETEVASASMAGGPLFKAHAVLRVPEPVSIEDIAERLEAIANELIVEFRSTN